MSYCMALVSWNCVSQSAQHRYGRTAKHLKYTYFVYQNMLDMLDGIRMHLKEPLADRLSA